MRDVTITTHLLLLPQENRHAYSQKLRGQEKGQFAFSQILVGAQLFPTVSGETISPSDDVVIQRTQHVDSLGDDTSR